MLVGRLSILLAEQPASAPRDAAVDLLTAVSQLQQFMEAQELTPPTKSRAASLLDAHHLAPAAKSTGVLGVHSLAPPAKSAVALDAHIEVLPAKPAAMLDAHRMFDPIVLRWIESMKVRAQSA